MNLWWVLVGITSTDPHPQWFSKCDLKSSEQNDTGIGLQDKMQGTQFNLNLAKQ